MELSQRRQFLPKKMVREHKKVKARIVQDVKEENGTYGKEYHVPLVLDQLGGPTYILSCFRSNLEPLTKKWGLNTNTWLQKTFWITTIDIVNSKGKPSPCKNQNAVLSL